MKDIEWFRMNVEPSLTNYEIIYKYFENGDFGSLNQVEFNSDNLGGNIDFWGMGWLGVFVWDYNKNVELLNVLLKPDQEQEREKCLEKMTDLLIKKPLR